MMAKDKPKKDLREMDPIEALEALAKEQADKLKKSETPMGEPTKTDISKEDTGILDVPIGEWENEDDANTLLDLTRTDDDDDDLGDEVLDAIDGKKPKEFDSVDDAIDEITGKGLLGAINDVGFLEFIDEDYDNPDNERENLIRVFEEDEKRLVAPINRLVNMILLETLRRNASELYIEKLRDQARIRQRIDGVLYEMLPPPRTIMNEIGIELERRFKKVKEEKIYPTGLLKLFKKPKVRVSSALEYGELVSGNLDEPRYPRTLKGAVLSLLKTKTSSGDQYRLKILYREYLQKRLQGDEEIKDIGRILRKASGLTLISAMPGHGKTTLAHNLLSLINRPDRNIAVVGGEIIENAYQYIPRRVNTLTSEVNSILKSLNPDTVYIDNISNPEYARLALDLARSRRVIASLDSVDAIQGLEYLTEINSSQLSRVLNGALGQRLVRKIHEECDGNGCDKCLNTGSLGLIEAVQYLVDEKTVDKLKKDIQKNTMDRTEYTSLYQVISDMVNEGKIKEYDLEGFDP